MQRRAAVQVQRLLRPQKQELWRMFVHAVVHWVSIMRLHIVVPLTMVPVHIGITPPSPPSFRA